MVIARLLATPKYAPCGIQKRDISCHWNVYLVKISLQSLKCYLMWSVFETASLFFRKSAWASWCCRCCDYKMTQYKRLKGQWTKPTPQHNRVIFAWPWDENARTKQKQQTNGSWAIWLIYRMDTNTRGFWLVKRTLGWKNFMPENFLEINRYFALTSYCNTIGQLNNAFSILGFSFAGKRRGHVLIFSSIGW